MSTRAKNLLRGRLVARYDYSVPLNQSGHTITLSEGTGTVASKGSFWADPATYEIVRISIEAVEIPPTLPVRAYVTTIDYTPHQPRRR